MDELDSALDAAETAVREAGLYLRENVHRRADVTFKGELDLVTEFDTGAQELLVDRLSRLFPGHGFLAEEGLSREGTSGCRWILDPLDGTTNFAHTFPVFSVSVALECGGEVVGGLVYDPTRDEMFRASAGGPAVLNGRIIRVSTVNRLDLSLLSTGFPYDVRMSPVNNLDHWRHFLVRAQAIRRCGSAALDLCYVACGRFDGFWELKLNPWDTAAGTLVILGAGGLVSDFSGGKFGINDPEVLATNGLIHGAMIDVLKLGRNLKNGEGNHEKDR